MSETFSSMCANSVAHAVVLSVSVSVDMFNLILPIVAHHARECPVLLRHFLDDDVEVGRLRARVLDHGLGNGADQRFFLRRRSSRPHLYGHNGHVMAPPAILFRSARGYHPIGLRPPSPVRDYQARVPRWPLVRAAWQRRNRRRPAAP